MNKDAVQHERGPRNSTIRRHMALYLKESSEIPPLASAAAPFRHPFLASSPNFPHLPPHNPFFSHHDIHSLTSSASPPISLADPTFSSNGLLFQPTPKYPFEVMQAYVSSPEIVCEAAARLLFMSVKWTKTVPAFVSLPYLDQALLLEEGWRELFVLGAAQFQLPLEAASLLAHAGLSGDASPSEAVVKVIAELRALQDIVTKFKAMMVDPTEFTCLKAIVLFKAGMNESSSPAPEVRSLRELHSVTALQDQAQLTLSKYIQSAYPSQPFRFGKLLLMLPLLRSISAKVIETVFFRKTIGAIPMERLLLDMFKSSDF